MDVQLAFGSDILMALDECPEYPGQPRVRAREHAAHRALGAAGRRALPAADWRRVATRHALFPIVQGSMFADLRRECAAALVDLDADGYAIGGLSVGEPRPLSLEMVEATRRHSAARTGRATPWGWECRRNCRNTWRAAST